MNRRSFLNSTIVLASAIAAPAFARTSRNERALSLYNTHTGETVKRVFWAEGLFIPDALQDISKLLRDHRNDKIMVIDPNLLILLGQVSEKFGSKQLHVISGYRSPETNRMLAAQSGGVAKHSMHLEGKAIDIRLPGCNLSQLHQAALAAKGGGVGYYPDSQFVHLDTGRLRNW